MNNRRQFLAVAGVLAVPTALIAACSSTSTSTTPAQLIADAVGAVQGIETVAQSLAVPIPPAKAAMLTTAVEGQIVASCQDFISMLNAISASTAATASATTFAKVVGGLNAFVSTLGAFPLPPQAEMIIAGVQMVLPELEAFIAQYVSPPPAPSASIAMGAAKAAALVTNIEQARQVLGVKTTP